MGIVRDCLEMADLGEEVLRRDDRRKEEGARRRSEEELPKCWDCWRLRPSGGVTRLGGLEEGLRW